MSATVSVSIRWDGTVISVTNVHDPKSEGSPADSTTNAHDIIGMLRDCANRAEDAVAASIAPPMEQQERKRLRGILQTSEAIRSVRQALHEVHHPDVPWEEAAEEPHYLAQEALAVVSAILDTTREER